MELGLLMYTSRSVQTMQLCSLGQGTVSQWSIVPRCPRMLQVPPTMSDSSQVSQLSQFQLPDIIGSTCNTLGQRGTMLHGDTVSCPKEKSCIVWNDLQKQVSHSDHLVIPRREYLRGVSIPHPAHLAILV